MDSDVIQYPFLGALIRFYRKRKHLKQEELALGICSVKTMQRIEKGNPFDFDSYYPLFAERLGLSVPDDEEMWYLLFEHEETIISFYSHDASARQFTYLKKKIDGELDGHEHILYWSEIMRLFREIIHFHLTGSLSDYPVISLLENCYPFLSGGLRQLALLLLFEASRFDKTVQPIQYYCAETKSIASLPLFRLNRVYRDMLVLSPSDLLLEYHERLHNESGMHSCYYRYMVYDALAYAEFNTRNPSDAYAHIRTLLNDEETQRKLPDHYLLQLEKRAGIIAYTIEDYKACSDHLLTVYRRDRFLLDLNYLLLFDSMKKTGKETELKKILRSLPKNGHHYSQTKNIIDYYQKRYLKHSDEEELEDLLCDFLSLEKIISPIYIPIIEKELVSLIKTTRNYKKFLRFKGYDDHS